LINPAALGDKTMNRFDVSLPISVMVGAAGSLVENADKLMKAYDADNSATSVKNSLDRLGNNQPKPDIGQDIKTISDFLTKDAKVLDQPGQGIRADVAAALTARWGRLGLSVGTRTHAGGTVRYDSNFSFSSTGSSSFLTQSAVDDIKLNTLAAGYNPANVAAVRAEMTTPATSGLTDPNIAYYVGSLEGVGSDRLLTTDEISLLASLADETNQVSAGTKTANNGTTTTKIDNSTGVEIRGLMTKEIAMAYSFSFLEDSLHIAPAIKLIEGETRYSFVRLLDSADTDIGDELTEDRKVVNTTTFGIDLGLMYQPYKKLNLGLVARDLNSPRFDMWDGSELELKPSVRAGVAYAFSQKPGWRGCVAFDADLIETKSAVLIGHSSQQLAFGLSQEMMGFLSLRAGAAKDLASEGDGVSYSAGIGLQLYRFYLDVGAALATEDVTVDGEDFPTRGGVGVTLGWNQNF
jgi:hypothetical protein